MATIVQSRSGLFGPDYYERGVEAGVSLYENYRWLGETTVALAARMVEHLALPTGARVLDYGCAKGYLVRALRELHYPAWGVDISEYAIQEVDPAVRSFCFRMVHDTLAESSVDVSDAPPDRREALRSFDAAIAKDVLEHVPYADLGRVLRGLACARRLFVVVPLGANGRYVVPDYERDVTHEIREPLEWWMRRLEESGWRIADARYHVPGIKESWSHFPRGNGFVVCHRQEQEGSL